VLIVSGIHLERKTFVAERNIRIFPRIEKVMQTSGEIVVGGLRQDRIPVEIFREILAKRYSAASPFAPIIGTSRLSISCMALPAMPWRSP
jgi:hypothetical protein